MSFYRPGIRSDGVKDGYSKDFYDDRLVNKKRKKEKNEMKLQVIST